MKCLSEAKKMVESGEVTWDDLADVGLIIRDVSRFKADYFKRKEEGSAGNNEAESK